MSMAAAGEYLICGAHRMLRGRKNITGYRAMAHSAQLRAAAYQRQRRATAAAYRKGRMCCQQRIFAAAAAYLPGLRSCARGLKS